MKPLPARPPEFLGACIGNRRVLQTCFPVVLDLAGRDPAKPGAPPDRR